MVKLKLKKKVLVKLLILIAIIAAIIVIILLIKKKPNISKIIIGTWSTPGGTIYTFKEDNTGVMKVPLNKYEFTYKIEDEKIIIDFKDKKAFDPTYEYSLDGETLVLKGDNGTFRFNRVIESNKKSKK